MRVRARRAGACVAGAALFLAALWGLIVVLFVAAIAGTPPVGDDPQSFDPCCADPETWGEIAALSGIAAGLAAVNGLMFALAGALVFWGVRRRWPRPRLYLWLAGGEAVLTLGAIGIAQLAA